MDLTPPRPGTEGPRKLEPPHLETQGRLIETAHPDLTEGRTAYNLMIRRWPDEPEAFVYIESANRDDPSPLMRLTVADAQNLIDGLAQGILCARVQNGIDLPSDEATA